MKDERDAILDDCLCRWHQWQRASVGRGYAPKSLVCGDYRTSRQYDDENGALDDDLENIRMRAVDFQVSEMQDPWKAAIYANARALVTGARVWSSPRLPEDPDERKSLIEAARAMLILRLLAAGVL